MTLTNFPNGIKVSGYASPASAAFTIGSEAGNEINVAVQLYDGAGDAIATRCSINWYLSDDPDGDTLVAAATSLAIGTDGLVIENISNSAGLVTTEADGSFDMTIGDASGAATYYLVLVMGDGRLIVSDAITFAA